MLGSRKQTALSLANQVLKLLRQNYSYEEIECMLRNLSAKYPRLKVLKVTPSFTLSLLGAQEIDVIFEFLRKIYIIISEIDEEIATKLKNLIITSSEHTDVVLNMLANEVISITKPYTQEEAAECLIACQECLGMHLFILLCQELTANFSPDEPVFGRIRDLELVDANISSLSIEPGKVRFEKRLNGDYWKTYNLLLGELLKYYEEKEGEKGSAKFFEIVRHILAINKEIAMRTNARESLLKGCFAEKIKVDIAGIERILESGSFPRKGVIGIMSERTAEGFGVANALASSFLSRYGSMAIALASLSIEEYLDLSALQFEAEEIAKSVFVDAYTARHRALESISQQGRIITVSNSLLSLEMGVNRAISLLQGAPLRIFIIEIHDVESNELKKFLNVLKNLAFEKDILFVILSPRNPDFQARISEVADGVFEIYTSAGDIKIRAVQVKWEEPDYTEYLLSIEGRKVEIGVRKRKKATRRLEEELGLVEEDPIEKYRRQLGHAYNYRIFEDEYLLCLRIPKESIEDLKDEDVINIFEKLKHENLEKLREKILSVYFICDKNYVETDIHRLIDALSMRKASPIHRAAEEIRSLRIGERDPVIRKLLDELSKSGARLGARLRRGSKAAEVTTTSGRGRVVGYRQAGENPQDIALLPTIKVAALKGRLSNSRFAVEIRKEDFQEKIRKTRTPVYLCFVVDTSGYEEPEIRGKIVTSLVISMLKDAYERRDHVALVTYSGNHATVQCDFTTDVEYVGSCMKRVEFGGLAPLGSALLTGLNLLHAKVGDRVGVVPILILLTTGTANVPITPGGNIRRELLGVCRLIWNSGYKVLVIDISERGSNLAREIALLTGGRYYHPQNLRYQKLILTRNLLDALRARDIRSAIEASKKFLREH